MGRKLCFGPTLAIFVGLALASCDLAAAQTDRADIRYETVSPRSLGMAATYRLGVRYYEMPDGSLLVAPRDEIAAERPLQSVTDPQVTRYLRRGDRITHIEGVLIDSPEAAWTALHASGGRPRVRIVDRETGQSQEWTMEAIRDLTTADQVPPPDPSPKADGAVRALLIAPTEDEKLSAAAKTSLANVRHALEQALPAERLEIVECVGERCDARGILSAVESIPCRQRDTLFVYVAGRAGFDSRYAIGEGFSTFDGFSLDDGDAASDDGQFLHLREGDLLRRSIWEAMLMRNARLTILFTDTCEDVGILNEAAGRYLTRELAKATDDVEREPSEAWASRRGWAVRLLGYTGRIDVSSAAAFAGERERSTNRSGWFDPERGGWFTEAWIRSAELLDQADRGDWSEALDLASQAASEQFAERKAVLSPKPAGLSEAARARIKAQANADGVVRTLAVTRDATLDHLPNDGN